MILQVLLFFVILSIVVLIHELGHFFAAKAFGVRVDEFGFGLPPKLFRLFRKGGTDFTINALPIGGFVRLYGENGESELGVPDDRAFWSKRLWQRGIVLVAGVVMNFVLGIFLFGVVYSFLGIPSKIDGVKINNVAAGSPAAQVGMVEGDVVKSLQIGESKTEIKDADSFLKLVGENKGKEIVFEVNRGGVLQEFKLIPRVDPPQGEGAVGIVITDSELKKYPWWEMPFRGAVIGTQEAWAWGREIVAGLGDLVWRLVTGKGISKDLAGPVGIYQISNEVRKEGILAMLQFIGVLSVNLAILNIMPFPALDGGRLVFLVLELVRGKRVKEEVEGWVNTVGMVLLLALMVLITFNDVVRIFGK